MYVPCVHYPNIVCMYVCMYVGWSLSQMLFGVNTRRRSYRGQVILVYSISAATL